ncbi:MAG TPA: cell division ATP-binding protein FtsE [Longimicrobiales bacterium]|nr:cell division ATP-binding protein FtsE [Longimicrobiales bacterium]
MINLLNVTKEYPRTGTVLDDVTFRLRKGEFCFLTGHSGAGKSTIMRLVHMAERPTSGEVRVSGYSSSSIRPREIALLRRKVGYVFQDFRLLRDRTASQNIAFALEVTGARDTVIRSKVARLLTHVGLASKSEALPTELSGGEQQRVAVARALAHDPLVLLADEPTGNLDERATRGIFDLFKSINASGTAVLFATHDLELVRAHPGTRVVELDHGRLVYDSGVGAVSA